MDTTDCAIVGFVYPIGDVGDYLSAKIKPASIHPKQHLYAMAALILLMDVEAERRVPPGLPVSSEHVVKHFVSMLSMPCVFSPKTW